MQGMRLKATRGREAQKREDLAKAAREPVHIRKTKEDLVGIMDSMQNSVTASITRGIARFKRRLTPEQMEILYEEGRTSELLDTIPWESLPEDLDQTRLKLEDTTLKGTEFAIERLPAPARKLQVSASNPGLRRFIDSQVGNLIVEVTNEQRRTVQSVVTESFRQGLTPKAASKTIRDSIGTTEKQSLRILGLRERERLEADTLRERLEELRARGKGDSKTAQNMRKKLRLLTDSQIERRVTKRMQAATKNRAVTIARTEITSAVNEGQAIAWQEASDRGLFDQEKAKKRWVSVPDQDRSDICRSLEGKTVPVDGTFYVEQTGESVPHPPAHPNCRSSVILEL